ncbi:Pol polyprotein [Plakobranchus ocellatus]|uniref:Pol polyprotein n=1 Tax=Plakobranchus ocellatus TaxID=259542 RepID=A0AAV3Y5R5_9GAST|nr:Pol polyprotein [Plakobranchus ocellatus]
MATRKSEASSRKEKIPDNPKNVSAIKRVITGINEIVAEVYEIFLSASLWISAMIASLILLPLNKLRRIETSKLRSIEQRWAAELVLFNLTIKYRPGKQDANVEAFPVHVPIGPGDTDVANCGVQVLMQQNTRLLKACILVAAPRPMAELRSRGQATWRKCPAE